MRSAQDDSWRLPGDSDDWDDSEDLEDFSDNLMGASDYSFLDEMGDAIAKLDNVKSAIALNDITEALQAANNATLDCMWGDYLAKRHRLS